MLLTIGHIHVALTKAKKVLTRQKIWAYNLFHPKVDAKGDQGVRRKNQSLPPIWGLLPSVYLILTDFAVKAHLSPLIWLNLMVPRKKGRSFPTGGSLPHKPGYRLMALTLRWSAGRPFSIPRLVSLNLPLVPA